MEATKSITKPTQWIERYADSLFKFAVSRVGDTEIAKDLVQEIFLSAWKSSSKFKDEIPERNWMFTILKNKIIDHYRSKSKSLVSSLDECLEMVNGYFDEEGNWQPSAKPQLWYINYSQNMEETEFYQVLEKCKENLNELQNAVFTMKYLDDYNSRKICKEMDISSSNVLQLPVVGVLEHSTVYNHKCKFNEIMFIYALPCQLLVGAVLVAQLRYNC